MPPSKCCTVRRLPSGLTMPGPMAELASGANIDQPARPPKKARQTATPDSIGPRGVRRRTGIWVTLNRVMAISLVTLGGLGRGGTRLRRLSGATGADDLGRDGGMGHT